MPLSMRISAPNCPDCLTRCYLSYGFYRCDDCGRRVDEHLGRVGGATHSPLHPAPPEGAVVFCVCKLRRFTPHAPAQSHPHPPGLQLLQRCTPLPEPSQMVSPQRMEPATKPSDRPDLMPPQVQFGLCPVNRPCRVLRHQQRFGVFRDSLQSLPQYFFRSTFFGYCEPANTIRW